MSYARLLGCDIVFSGLAKDWKEHWEKRRKKIINAMIVVACSTCFQIQSHMAIQIVHNEV